MYIWNCSCKKKPILYLMQYVQYIHTYSAYIYTYWHISHIIYNTIYIYLASMTIHTYPYIQLYTYTYMIYVSMYVCIYTNVTLYVCVWGVDDVDVKKSRRRWPAKTQGVFGWRQYKSHTDRDNTICTKPVSERERESVCGSITIYVGYSMMYSVIHTYIQYLHTYNCLKETMNWF